jgi:hypothetical protein
VAVSRHTIEYRDYAGPVQSDLNETLVRELTEPLIADLSPAEQGELFDLLSEAHFAHPEAYTRRDRTNDPLAFGLPELTVLLTPVMLAAMNEAVRYVVASALARGTRATANAIRRLFGHRGPDNPNTGDTLVLTDQQWSEIRRIVEQVARKGGVAADQAEVIADAVIGRGASGRTAS